MLHIFLLHYLYDGHHWEPQARVSKPCWESGRQLTEGLVMVDWHSVYQCCSCDWHQIGQGEQPFATDYHMQNNPFVYANESAHAQ